MAFEAMESGVERTGVDLEDVAGVELDGLADAVAVLGSPAESLEDQEVERALEKLDAVLIAGWRQVFFLREVESLHPSM